METNSSERKYVAKEILKDFPHDQTPLAPKWYRGLAASRAIRWAGITIVVIAAIWIRLFALDSDAYPRLSWSSALLTDEGFYMHNARNLVLFGTERTDEFNNMLIMPVLHGIQVLVFRSFGVGIIQARSISVAISLATLPVFFLALKQSFKLQIAIVATLFLGLDHISVMYSRLALMDTPSTGFMICALYAFVRGLRLIYDHIDHVEHRGRTLWRARLWWFACGISLGLVFATRGLAALSIPCFIGTALVSTRCLSFRERSWVCACLFAGVASSIGIYLVAWFIPNHAEIVRMNRYYVDSLLIPHSFDHWYNNVKLGFFDFQRGMMPYLVRHSPVQLVFAVAAVAWSVVSMVSRSKPASSPTSPGIASYVLGLLTANLVVYWVFLASVNYAPSRYYVLFYPFLASASAFAIANIQKIVRALASRTLIMSVCCGYLICLIGQMMRSSVSVISSGDMAALFRGIVVALVIGATLSRRDAKLPVIRKPDASHRYEVVITSLALWLIVNTYWVGDWLNNLTYHQIQAGKWLAEHLPDNSTLIGAVAPGLCINNRFKAVNVIEGLCNDKRPIETAAPPRFVAILDENKWLERRWKDRYPVELGNEKRVFLISGLLRDSFQIGIYDIDGALGSKQRDARLLFRNRSKDAEQ